MTNKKLEAQKKVQDAIEAKAKAIQTLNLALKDSVQLVKKDMEETATAYEKNLEEFQAKAYNEMNETKVITAKKVAELEQKNEAMITRLSNYQDTTQVSESFELFRYELGRELSETGKSLKSFNSNI
jgi:hypothetical protein